MGEKLKHKSGEKVNLFVLENEKFFKFSKTQNKIQKLSLKIVRFRARSGWIYIMQYALTYSVIFSFNRGKIVLIFLFLAYSPKMWKFFDLTLMSFKRSNKELDEFSIVKI